MKENSYPTLKQKMISHTLPNGLEICIFPKPGFRRSYAQLSVNYGSNDIKFNVGGEDYTSPLGVAHFLEHKVFEQPDGGNALAIFAKTGASPNAFTSNNMTAYHFSGTEKFMRNLEVLLSFVTSPYFTEENVAKEQGIIGQEISMVNDRPGWRVYENLMGSLYITHPVKDSIIGTVESIGEITRDVLFKCYNTFYVPSNMALCVAGDVSAEDVIAAAEAILPKTKAEVPKRDYGIEEKYVRRARVEEAAEIAIPQFAVGAKCAVETFGDAGMRNKIIAFLAADVLAGPSSALYSRLYANGDVTSDFSSEAMLFPGTVTMMISGESRNPDAVFEKIKERAYKLSKDIDVAYFERIRKAHIGVQRRSTDSVKSLCREQSEAVFAGYDYLDTIRVINEIEPFEVAEFIGKVFKEESMALSIVRGK